MEKVGTVRVWWANVVRWTVSWERSLGVGFGFFLRGTGSIETEVVKLGDKMYIFRRLFWMW